MSKAPTIAPSIVAPIALSAALGVQLQQAAALHQQGQLAQADALYGEILRQQADHFDTLHLAGICALQLGQAARAVDVLTRAIALDVSHPSAYSNLGLALQTVGRHDEAEVRYGQALRLDPNHLDALYNLGHLLQQSERDEAALDCYDSILGARSSHANVLANRGKVLRRLGRHGAALDSYERALIADPEFALLLVSRGNVLRDLGRHQDALASYEKALAKRPDDVDVWIYRGAALMDLRRYRDAQASYARALAISPEHAEARWNGALCHLLLGDFEAGWRLYEARWDSRRLKVPRREFPHPLWLGVDDLRGKRLLIHAEQGFGDTLQFCRYVSMLAGRASEIIVEVQPELKNLLRSLAGVDRLLAQGEALPPFDLQCPMLSLPLACRTTLRSIPVDVPYLSADPARIEYWKAQMGRGNRLNMNSPVAALAEVPTAALIETPVMPRIGLTWRGSGVTGSEPRFLSFAVIARLLDAPAEFASLHVETHADDAAALAACDAIQLFGTQLTDFSETAALMASLDLVITADTAVAHLAGALGKPVWILLPFNADWRWLTERSDSPWYPSARLFRQTAQGDWLGVIAAVADELSRFLRQP